MAKLGITETYAMPTIIVGNQDEDRRHDGCAEAIDDRLSLLECWGGATFDSCLRALNEDPGSGHAG